MITESKPILASALVLLAVAALVAAPLCGEARASVAQYRWVLKSDLDPFGEDTEDPQLYANGFAYIEVPPIDNLIVWKDYSGVAYMYQYIPEVRAGEWVEGSFTFRCNDYYEDAEEDTYIHDIVSDSTKGLRFLLAHQDDETFYVGIEGWNGSKQWGPYYLEDASGTYECDLNTTYRLNYLIHAHQCSSPWWNAINLSLDVVSGTAGVASIHVQERTLYNDNWTRLLYGMTKADHLVYEELEFNPGGDHPAEFRVHSNEPTGNEDDLIEPEGGIQSGARWLLCTSLDPYDTVANDPHTVPVDATGYIEEATGHGGDDCDFAMSATADTTEPDVYMKQCIPGVAPEPDGYYYETELEGYTASLIIKGKFWVKLDSEEAGSGDYTTLHRLVKTDGTGFRIGVVHSATNGEATLRFEQLMDDEGNVVPDEYATFDDDGPIDWTENWHYITYTLSRHYDLDEEEWTDFTVDVEVDGSPAIDSETFESQLGLTTGGLREVHYGVEVDSSREETWLLDDAWISAGIYDYDPT